MVPQQGHSLLVQQPWKGAHFSKSQRARHTSRVTFLHTLWITNQPPMLFIDPNTPWNRASLSYLRDMQHTHKLFLRNQNTLDDVASKSKHRRSLSLSALLSVSVCVCLCVDNLVAKKVQFCVLDSGTSASWMCICISLSVCQCLCACVCVFVCGLATAVLLPSLSGRCMVHTLFHLPAPLSVTWAYGLLWLAGRGAGEDGELGWMARGRVQPLGVLWWGGGEGGEGGVGGGAGGGVGGWGWVGGGGGWGGSGCHVGRKQNKKQQCIQGRSQRNN